MKKIILVTSVACLLTVPFFGFARVKVQQANKMIHKAGTVLRGLPSGGQGPYGPR